MEYAELEKHILQLEKRLMTCEYNELNELLADEFMEFGSSGNTYDKKAQLEASGRTDGGVIKFTVTEFKLDMLASDIVLATYRTYRHHDGKHALRSSIWKHSGGSWQMHFHQGTPAGPLENCIKISN
ncbi:DUF4440 domain-containing protein [Peribacillus sp. SCS-26]|uniref:nuclear transport factor 2 family protein n=1 Tax=Paraperibacillus marinus TaxID=3115295 RepID=UPI003905D117